MFQLHLHMQQCTYKSEFYKYVPFNILMAISVDELSFIYKALCTTPKFPIAKLITHDQDTY